MGNLLVYCVTDVSYRTNYLNTYSEYSECVATFYRIQTIYWRNRYHAHFLTNLPAHTYRHLIDKLVI